MPDLSVAPVAIRTQFRGSTLYKSFVECKVDRTLARAKLVSGEQRMALVQSCQNLPSLPTGVKDTIEVVSTLFDDNLAMKTRVQYLADCCEERLPRSRHAMGPTRHCRRIGMLHD